MAAIGTLLSLIFVIIIATALWTYLGFFGLFVLACLLLLIQTAQELEKQNKDQQ